MARKEKFGKFVLLEHTGSSGLGSEYRAAKLGPTGLEKIITILKLGPAVSSNPEVAKNLMDQAKLAAQLQNPNVVKILGIGKVDAHYYISHEFVEGKSLRSILDRCKSDGFPFSIDHVLLIASKVCSALEYAHGRKGDTGARYFHGFVNPSNVVVSYEGEVRLRGFGHWPSRIREAGAIADPESLYLSPEQAEGGAGETRSDSFAVGAILFESLTGEPLFLGGRTRDIAARIAESRLQNPTGEDDALPKPIGDILQRALAIDPTRRYGEIQEMRKAIDTLLFSGDFTPTTFNLAFFMHSLFREDIERESKLLKEEKEASYLEFLAEEAKAIPRAAASGRAATATATPTPVPVSAPAHAHTGAPPAAPPPAAASRVEAPHVESGQHAAAPEPAPHREAPKEVHPAAAPVPAHHEASPGLPAKAAAAFTFHREEPKSRKPLMAGIAAVVVIGAVAAVFLLRAGGTQAPVQAPGPSTLSAEAQAVARVRELEEKLKALEAEKAAAEAKAVEEARKKLEAQAAARGQTADPSAIAKAQEEAARKARFEQEKKQQEELRRLEEEKKAEEARLAEEQRKAEEQRQAEEAARLAAATTLPAPPPTTAPPAPAIRPGTLMNLSDPGVTPPVVERQPQLQYPPIALRQRVEGTVELNVLVDEKGIVTDAQVVSGAGGKAGLNEAAVDNVKKRRYRPATKDGVPVKVWMPVRVVFELPRS